MTTKRQQPKPYVQRVQDLRRSNAAQPIRNRKRSARQDRYAGRLDSRRSEW
jgi:hypothetical protein